MGEVVLADCRGRRNEGRKRMENLGLGFLAAALERGGHTAEVLDASFHGRRVDWLAARLRGRQPLLLGFSLFFNNADETLRLIRRLRRGGLRGHITLGGHHATFTCRELLADWPEVDSVVRGEGEEALVELTDRLVRGLEWRDVPNVACRAPDGRLRLNPCRPLAELDRLPPPSRRAYADAIRADGWACVSSSRGCYGSCSFCSIRSFLALQPGPCWRARSPASVVDEIEALAHDYGVRHVNFVDDDFLGPGRRGKERALAIASLLEARRLGVTFIISARPDNLDEPTLRRLKEAGLICVDIGAESWLPRQLEFYRKKTTPAKNDAAIETLERVGVEYRVYLVLFDPYIALDELEAAVMVAQRLGSRHLLDMWLFSRVQAFPGTPLAESLERDGLLRSPFAGGAHTRDPECRFQRPEVRRLFAAWQACQPAYAALDRRAKSLVDLKRGNPAETLYSFELQAALKRAALDLFRRCLRLCQSGRALRPLLERGFAQLDAQMAAIEAAQASGRFRQFAPTRLRLGREVLRFPPPAIAVLGERLVAQIQETGA